MLINEPAASVSFRDLALYRNTHVLYSITAILINIGKNTCAKKNKNYTFAFDIYKTHDEPKRELLKTQNSRLAPKKKAEFTVVNEHFVEGA